MKILSCATMALILLLSTTAAAQWRYNAQTDALRDATNYSAILSATDRNGALVFRNNNGRLEAYASVIRGGIVDYDTRNHDVRIAYRFDAGPIENTQASSSTDRVAVFFTNPTQFAQRVAAASKLIIEIPMYRRTPVQLTFDLTGFSLEKLGLQPPPDRPKQE